jgi:hypothetical protein
VPSEAIGAGLDRLGHQLPVVSPVSLFSVFFVHNHLTPFSVSQGVGQLQSYPLTFFTFDRVEERAKVGLVIPLPLQLELAHIIDGFIPAFRTGLRLALLFLYFFSCSHKSLTFDT